MMTGALAEFADAIKNGDSSTVELLISTNQVDLTSARFTLFKKPALALAASLNQREIVEILLKANANVDSAGLGLRTACHWAAHNGFVDVLAVLLAARPDVNRLDEEKSSPLKLAIMQHHEQCALMLMAAGAVLTADLHCAAAACGVRMLHELRQRGVVAISDLRRQGMYAHGDTPLHAAAENARCNRELMTTLVREHGCDVDFCDRSYNTPCHAAARSAAFENLQWLIGAGADFDMPNSHGQTPLHLAHYHGSTECSLLLIAAGADVRARDMGGNSPSHTCRQFNKSPIPEIVHALLAAGASLDATNRSGVTAREELARLPALSTSVDDAAGVEAARRRIATMRALIIRDRSLQICVGLHPLGLDALQMCAILQQACCGGRLAQLVPFHIWWKIATTVKHFRESQ